MNQYNNQMTTYNNNKKQIYGYSKKQLSNNICEFIYGKSENKNQRDFRLMVLQKILYGIKLTAYEVAYNVTHNQVSIPISISLLGVEQIKMYEDVKLKYKIEHLDIGQICMNNTSYSITFSIPNRGDYIYFVHKKFSEKSKLEDENTVCKKGCYPYTYADDDGQIKFLNLLKANLKEIDVKRDVIYSALMCRQYDINYDSKVNFGKYKDMDMLDFIDTQKDYIEFMDKKLDWNGKYTSAHRDIDDIKKFKEYEEKAIKWIDVMDSKIIKSGFNAGKSYLWLRLNTSKERFEFIVDKNENMKKIYYDGGFDTILSWELNDISKYCLGMESSEQKMKRFIDRYNKLNEKPIEKPIEKPVIKPIANDLTNQILNATITFGKYKGQTYNQILKSDKSYASWLVNSCDIIKGKKDIYEALKKSI